MVAYANGRASHARHVKGDDPDKKRYPGSPEWEFGMTLTAPPLRNTAMKPQGNEAGWISRQ